MRTADICKVYDAEPQCQVCRSSMHWPGCLAAPVACLAGTMSSWSLVQSQTLG